MLTKLSIQNYALIEDISIEFHKGFTTISGETGAGKSILLGGLGLILGNRADTKSLRNPQEKCIIEGEFSIADYNLVSFFNTNDLDYDAQTIIRRELLPSGKSRAFINDTPVRLGVLSDLQNKLIDIHSQHQTLHLNDTAFQFQIVDSLANTKANIDDFKRKHQEFERTSKDFYLLKEKIKRETEQHDYHTFLLEELEKADFKEGEQEKLEKKIESLNNFELIQQNLNESYSILSDEEQGIVSKLYHVKQNIIKIQEFSSDYKDLTRRLESLYVELKDIEAELFTRTENDSFNIHEIEKLNDRLQLLFHLFQKHKVNTIADLQLIQSGLAEKVSEVNNAEKLIKDKEKQVLKCQKELFSIGKGISEKRKNITPKLEKELAAILKDLGMPHAQFRLTINQTHTFYTNGIDQLQFLFNANEGGSLASMKQIASGGELSRIMLAIKSVMASHTQLPSLIFDEIDSGISGEVALKMAEIMKKMATTMQVISITHIPQIAATGSQQMKVYKTAINQLTQTKIKLLNSDERIQEIAEMLGGKTITETAINHAKQLLH